MKHDRKIIYLAGFLFSIPIALTSYINSSFLELFSNPGYIGIIYAVASLLTIVGMFEMPRTLTKFGNRKTAIYFSLLTLLSFLVMSFGQSSFIVVLAFIIYFISTNSIIFSLDVFVEDLSRAHSIGRLRGLYLMTSNFAWIIAQAISGSIIAKSSLRGIYLLSALFMALVCFVFVFFLRGFKDPEYEKVPVLTTIKNFFANKQISKIYFLGFILKFFFAWMIIYTPIYLHQYLGFDWGKIGIIFTIMLLPFVLLEFPLGKLSDRVGEKKMLLIGFLVSALATLVIPLIAEPKLWLWALVLFTTRVGAATIEIMTESYFFKSVHKENDDQISFFRNTGPLSFIVAPLLATPILLLVPSFKYLFVILGAIMLLGFLLTLRLKDVK